MRIGLALSGGSVRGAAHIGVLKCLHESYIYPGIVSGASAGSIVAGLYASGLGPSDLERVAASLKASQIVDIHSPLVIAASMARILVEAVGVRTSLLKHAPCGIIKGTKLEQFLRKSGMARSFDQMRLPCVVVATQLDNGRQVVFTDRKTAEVLRRRYRLRRRRTVVETDVEPAVAITASCSIPGIFTPRWIRRMQLVDGGVRDNLPLECLDMLRCNSIIGVNLGYSGERREGVDNIAEVVSQSVDIMAAQSVDLVAEAMARKYRNRFVRVEPKIYDVGLFEIGRIKECIDRGYSAMRKCLPAMRRATLQALRQDTLIGS
jgi:NTE family protein